MRTSLNLDSETLREIKHIQTLTRENRATIIRLAIRAGLRAIVNRFQALRPEDYFASDYPLPKDRSELESAMTKIEQRPDR